MTQHTPGPWRYNAQGNTIRSETHGFVAGLNDVAPADARLMTGAPDLLTELQRAVEMIEEANRKGASQIVPASMRAAIAKATGGAA